MNVQQTKFVRFEGCKSESSWSPEQQHAFAYGGLQRTKLRRVLDATVDGFWRGFENCFGKIKSLRISIRPSILSGETVKAKSYSHEKKILDPQGRFVQEWNKIFLISCVIALALDPLFFYIPVLDGKSKRLELDDAMKITACVLRSVTDLFYIFHIILKFRTGFIAPSSRVFGRGELVDDPLAISRRYLSSYFLVDILAILPVPQVVTLHFIPSVDGPTPVKTKESLKFIIYAQYVPRIIRIYPLYKEVNRTSGILTQTAWAGAASNLLLYMLASHVIGAFWYSFAIEREFWCWPEKCNFGMFNDAHKYRVVEWRDFRKKLFYCFWWGLRNLSSYGQGLTTSTSITENAFAVAIAIIGLVLFALLIGNMQKYLQSATVRVEEMRERRSDAERWMSHRMLPDSLRQRIRRYEQYKWQVKRGVDEEFLISSLPKDLRRDIKRHLCLDLLMRVPMFEKMDEQLLDAMCDRLKPVLYTEKSLILREGDPVDEMLFIIRGDFCGEELLTWALDPNSSSNLPTSTRTVETITEVEAFLLTAEDLKFVASQFRRLHSKQLQHAFRFYSQQWRTWAACFIQAAWHRLCKRKQEAALHEAEHRLQDTLANESGTSTSLSATFYASKFAANALRALRSRSGTKNRIPRRLPALVPQKPTEPDFGAANDY